VFEAFYGKSLITADADRPAEGWLQTMCPRGEPDANREEPRGTETMPDPIARFVYLDPKAFVMTYLHRLVASGLAEWHTLENGDIRLRLLTGETYLLAKATVIRIA
jgi:hypothetical protein